MSLDGKLVKSIEQLLDKKLNPIQNRLDVLVEKVKKIDSIEDSLNFLSSKYDELNKKVADLENNKRKILDENEALRSQVLGSNKVIQQMKKDISDMHQYSRRDCVEIRGIPFVEDEVTNEIVINVAQRLDIEVNNEDISISHRLPKRQGNHDSAIIVKFVRRSVKDQFYKNRRMLRNISTKDIGYLRYRKQQIFISESLTPANRELFNLSLQKKKELSYKYIWTMNGVTYLRKDDDNHVIPVKDKKDLDKLR